MFGTIPIETSALNSRLINHAANKSLSYSLSPPSGYVPQTDGSEISPAHPVLPSPIFKIAKPTQPRKRGFGGMFSDLFSARKANQ